MYCIDGTLFIHTWYCSMQTGWYSMIEVDLTPDMVEYATKKAYELGSLPGSMTKGKGNIIGFLGKIAVCDYYGFDFIDAHGLDIIFGKISFSVKTKAREKKPMPHYVVSIAEMSIKNDSEMYIFTCVNYAHTKAWILGFYPKESYLKNADYMVVGETDGSNSHEKLGNCYNMEISQLKRLDKNDLR